MKSNMIFPNGFSHEEVDYINREADKLLDIKEAVVGEVISDVELKIRKSKTGWIGANNPEQYELWSFIQSRLWNFVNAANRENFSFDVSYLDSVQYTIYEAPGDHYDWHIDTFVDTPNAFHRKLSLTLQLTDGYEYEGGDFQLNDGQGTVLPRAEIRQKGAVLIFPSFLSHRVTPITKGTRRTIVAWFEGRQFR